ncbi:MAG: branched-chain amino acid ABC transporter permease [Chloroflexi bacterium]|nr:branched-chain amino acid ABC transporter permease [Chloroflexota bacterium]
MSCVNSLEAQFFSSLLYGLTLGCIYALFALGYSMVYGVLGLINFAHSEVFMIGSFAALGVLVVLTPVIQAGQVPLILALSVAALVAILVAGVAAVALEVVAYRPLRIRNAPRHAAMISGMGASIFLQEVFAIKFGRNILAFPEVWPSTPLLQIGDGLLTNKMLVIGASTIVMLLVVDYVVGSTRIGRGIRAMAQEPRAAILTGVDVSTVVLITFLIGGLCAGLGGFLYGMYYTKTVYYVGFVPGIKAFAAAVLGGVGNMRGAVLGGLTLGLMENFGVVCIPTQLKDVIAFGVLVLVLLFRPSGLFGQRLAGR